MPKSKSLGEHFKKNLKYAVPTNSAEKLQELQKEESDRLITQNLNNFKIGITKQ